jgi:hypothetical protein
MSKNKFCKDCKFFSPPTYYKMFRWFLDETHLSDGVCRHTSSIFSSKRDDTEIKYLVSGKIKIHNNEFYRKAAEMRRQEFLCSINGKLFEPCSPSAKLFEPKE